MELNLASTCDVLVLGSGIAGISAALTAAESGASVILVCKGRLFSGSSFYPGTWGLGLVGPADEADEADLISTIEDVGCGMADDALVRALVKGIHPAIEKVRSMGVRLRKAGKGGQQEYIPCFDHKHRDWNGIEFDSAREIYSQRLEELGVTILPAGDAGTGPCGRSGMRRCDYGRGGTALPGLQGPCAGDGRLRKPVSSPPLHLRRGGAGAGIGSGGRLPSGQYGVHADYAWLSVAGVSDHF